MTQSKILFPTDFSHTGDAALQTAVTLAKARNAKLLVVHVEEPPPVYGGGDWYYGIPTPQREQLLEMLHKVDPKDPAVPCEHHLLTGDPAEALLEFAEREKVELIVMATHGRTGVLRFLMGSVAEVIVRKAPCPVLTMRDPTRAHRAAASS
jgi:nucleotide-binding universal stress UspA family protein